MAFTFTNQRNVMSSIRQKASVFFVKMSWPIWVAYAFIWSASLLTPQPVQIRDAVLSERPAIFTSKFLHVGGYLGFAVLSAGLRLPAPFRWLLLAFLSLHAFGTEYLQQFVPQRTPSLVDAGLDHIGIVLGLAITWKLWFSMPAKPVIAEPACSGQ
jgi:VanZ family protein